MTDLTLTLSLSDKALSELQSEAQARNMPVDQLIQLAIEFYLDWEEDSDEDVLDGIRQGMLDALAGRTRPAHEVLDEMLKDVTQ